MTSKIIFFVRLCCLTILLSSCNSKKMEDQNATVKSEEFSTTLPDGEYLVDSSSGVKTYALIEAQKLKKFRASTFDGKSSKIGYVSLRMDNQPIIAGPTAKEKCLNKGCEWGCLTPISTSNSAEICNCVCPGNPPTPSQGMSGILNVDMLGPSFKDTKVSGLQVKLTLELDGSVAPGL